ncbi:MAG TPA: TatD family hydrolase [Fimbriimonadaceae bacterium]|nr:TatD family hydrolase [Fimbriimonadaceae bacterium]
MLVDTHCHLNLIEEFPDPAAEVDYARREGVDRQIVIGIDLPTSRYALELAEQFPDVYASSGIHPNSTADLSADWLDQLRDMLRHPNCVALGEVGLDYHWDFSPPVQQKQALEAQLDLAEELHMPVVLHCRKAYGDLLDLLESRRPAAPLVFHCFSGTSDDAGRAGDLEAYFGVDGPLTYKNASELREIVRILPRDRVLIETDAPYLTPVPHRGKPNRPAYVKWVNEMLASLWHISPEECGQITTQNAERFFGLP